MLTAAEMARAVRAGQTSPVELVEEALGRAERWQPRTNAFSQLHPEEALEAARSLADEAARGASRGPLHGVPVAVKDLFDVAGWETSGCCQAYRGSLAREDSALVRRLRGAGAVLLGKTNQHELAAGGTNAVSACGPTRNPWDPARLTGGSSGGSGAAVAARVVPVAIGTDTGGSIRIPASFCGVAGLKPTFGRVDMAGAMTLAPSMDTAGPMAVTAADLALAFCVVAGEGPGFLEEAGRPAGGLRAGLLGGFFARARPEVAAAVEAVAEGLRAGGVAARPADVGDLSDSPEVWNRIAWVEFAAGHGRLLRRPEALYAPTRRLLEYGAARSGVEYFEASRRAEAIRGAFLAALREVDLLIAPATPFPAPPSDAEHVELGDGEALPVHRGGPALFTRVVNLTGLPAVSVLAGFSGEGLPLGAQLIARPGGEATLLRAAAAVQAVADHHLRVPGEEGG